MVITWPRELVLDVARRRSVLVLGAGISCQARNLAGKAPKAWKTFLDAAVARVAGPVQLRAQIKLLINQSDYLTACQVIKEKMGAATFHDFVREEFLVPDFKPAPIHKAIRDLDSRIVATPNFDKIYENQSASMSVKQYHDDDVAEAIRATSRLVLKIHGSVDTPSKMVFTRKDYAAARHAYRTFYRILEALVLTHTFVFFGCGLNDPDIRLLLEDYGFRHNVGRPHYVVLPRGNVSDHVQPAIEESLNVKILTYDPKSDHRLLRKSIEELNIQVSLERLNLTHSGDW